MGISKYIPSPAELQRILQLPRKVAGKVRNYVRPQPYNTLLNPHFPSTAHPGGPHLLLVCSRGFNQSVPTAATLMREGFARGWASAVGPATLVPAIDMESALDQAHKPAVFMSVFDYEDMTPAALRRLRDADLFLWVGIHPKNARRLEAVTPHLNVPELLREHAAYAKALWTQPKFVWNAVGQAGMEWYNGWLDDGFAWETIWPAADETRYFPQPDMPRFGHVKMAYVGGYWAEKAQGFDMYLRPWEETLWTYGYAKWPYKQYGGPLDEASERRLYSTAGLIPLVTSPYGWRIAEITERYIKVPACKGFGISDHNPALREVFGPDEMLQAESPEHFHQMVRDFLAGRLDPTPWKERGFAAVQARHTYHHRALQIAAALERAHGRDPGATHDVTASGTPATGPATSPASGSPANRRPANPGPDVDGRARSDSRTSRRPATKEKP